jgi:DinB superfamily
MTPAERGRVLNYLAESRDNLLRLTRGLSQEQLEFKPAPDRWSIAECLEHLIMVENNRVAGGITAALQQPVDPSKRSAFEGRDEELVQMVTNRGQRGQAPEMLRPTGRQPDSRLVFEFEAARKRTSDLVATTNADLRKHFSLHPRFGDLDCYQWLLLVAGHCDRHCQQIEEVAASPGFPRAAAI